MRNTLAKRRDESGAIAVVFAVSALILFVVAGLVVDLGLARDTRRDSQNAADASALAAAAALYPSAGACFTPATSQPCFADAVQRAKDYAAANFDVAGTDWAACTDPNHFYFPSGSTPCISFTDDASIMTLPASPTKVRVKMPTRTIASPFGTLAGISTIPVSSAARASLSSSTAVSCALCFMGAINSKKFKVAVDGAGVFVNGNVDFQAAGANWTASSIAVAGATNRLNGTPPATSVPAPTGNPDPWATKAGIPPNIVGLAVQAAGADPCAKGQGVYGDWQFSHACTLPAGIYVITGDWTWKNITVKTAVGGVTLYATCGSRTAPTVCSGASATGGSIDTKNGDIELTAPASGLGIIYDRENHSPLGLQGNGNVTIAGALYAPASMLNYNGGSDVRVTGGPVILGSMDGNGTTGIHVESGTPVTIPGIRSDPALDQ